MAKELDEIIYEAIAANETLQTETGGRIHSTCIEVPPTDDDNTPLPYIIIAEEQLQNEQGTKDNVWEGDMDHVAVSVIISANSPADVKRLRRLVRQAIGQHVESLGNDAPYLTALTSDGIAWDWTKPCYYDTLHYQCDMDVQTEESES